MISNPDITPAPTTEEGAADSGPFVRTKAQGAIFRVELNRPLARNPLGADMMTGLESALDEAEKNPAIRVILFTAAGKVFSAGGDLGNIASRLAVKAGPDGKDPIAAGNRRYGAFLMRLCRTSRLTVASVQGPAMGGGAGLVCAVDITIGSPTARFGFPEVGVGLVPGQILPFVSARIGLQAARRLMLTGERIDAVEAYRIGLLDYLVASPELLEQRTQVILEQLVAAGPSAGAATKSLASEVRALDFEARMDLSAYLDAASDAFARQMRTEAVEGVTAARERRQTQWNTGAVYPDLTKG